MKLLIRIINIIIVVIMWIALWRLMEIAMDSVENRLNLNPIVLNTSVFVSALILMYLVNRGFQFRYTFY
jgi:hypothetical protein